MWRVSNDSDNIFILFDLRARQDIRGRREKSPKTNFGKAAIYPKGPGLATIRSIDNIDIVFKSDEEKDAT